jgi:hypothetical protein
MFSSCCDDITGFCGRCIVASMNVTGVDRDGLEGTGEDNSFEKRN